MGDVSLYNIDVFDPDSWDEYVWLTIREKYFDPPAWWPTKHGAVRLYEQGMFGAVCHTLDRMADRETIEPLIDGECMECGADGAGNVGPAVRGTYEMPDGESFFVSGWDVFCDECAERIIAELEEYGQRQPTLSAF